VSAFEEYRRQEVASQRELLNRGAAGRERSIARHPAYYENLRECLGGVVERGKRVLCLRSDVGQYLEWVDAAYGVGVEIAPELNRIAREQRPQYEFHTVDSLEDLEVDGPFDYVLIVDAVNELFDVQETLEGIAPLCTNQTRLVISFYNFLWQPLARLAQARGLKREQPLQSWLSSPNLRHLLNLAGFECIREQRSLLWPFRVPLLSRVLNGTLAKLPWIEKLCLVNTVVARRQPARRDRPEASVSVVIPCRNEAGNVEAAVRRTPEMGAGTELLFCDDRSTDGTADEVRRMQAAFPERKIRLIEGPGINKAENVWAGFDAAENDVLMILDGDLAVPPEELPKFYRALVEGRGEFINGTRMVYPMRDQAMRLANVFGNKLFSLLFSHILSRDISDTLCGTKVLWRGDYERLKPLRGSWGIEDRWGDYELIFGAAKLNLAHVDLPVHYMERTYGETKMTGRLRNAWVMLRMCLAAFRRLR
jgi:hypothetical protein